MQIKAQFDREKVWYRGDSVRYLVVSVSDPGGGRPPAPVGLNIGLVVDASGSMAGRPLEFAVTAAQQMIDCLTDEDRLSVVSFDDEVKDHIIAAPMTFAGRARALQSLGTIQAGRNTNLSAGWFRGAEHIARGMESGGAMQHRVIVLSDGHANEGIVDPSELAKHASQLALRRLFSSTVGIGDNYNNHTLEAIAVHGGGAHHRAARPQEIVEVVTAELQDIRRTIAENITISLRHAPGVRIKCLNEFPLNHEDDSYICNVGSLTAGASRTAVFSVRFPSGEVGLKCPFEIHMEWHCPGVEKVYVAEFLPLEVQFAEGKENNAQPYDASSTETVAQVWQAYIVRRIVRLNREGRYAEAIKRLDHDLPLFAKYAAKAVSGPVLTAELERLRGVANREWSEASRKEVEVAMYQRTSSRSDSRKAVLQSWIAYASQQTSSAVDEIEEDFTVPQDNAGELVQSTGVALTGTLESLMVRFRKEFPQGFSDRRYLDEERDDKCKVHDLFQEQLGVEQIRDLLLRGEIRELVKRALRVLGKANLLAAKFEVAPLKDAMDDETAARSFFEALAELLDATSVNEPVFEKYLAAIFSLPAPRGRVASWPVATVFPFIARPDIHMFLKPNVTKKAARSIGFDPKYKTTPNWTTYQRLLQMSTTYLELLRPFGAIDFIDVQSFIHASCGGKDRDQRKQTPEVVVKAESEEGGIRILRAKQKGKNYQFRIEGDEVSSTNVDSLDKAFQELNACPWHSFDPVEVHPDLRVEVLREVRRKGGDAEEKRWKTYLEAGAV
jgi:Ca-activated chloride channel family protein